MTENSVCPRHINMYNSDHHRWSDNIAELIRVGHRRNDDPTIVYMTLLLKYTTAQILVLMKRVLKLREGRRMK